MLELRSITKQFGKTIAVNDLSIASRENEFIVIFGPAGAGKTTTLRLIAGVIEATEGEIWLNGHPMADVAPEHRNISMAFENYALYSHLSVFDNIAFPLRARKFSSQEIEKQVHDMADVLQVSSLLDRRPGFLSGGQRQRVALGRALVRDADVYLLDEPISHLDAKLRHRMRSELKAICAHKNATVIHVTHDYREAMALSDRIIVLNDGHMMQVGTPDEIFHYPENEFVAGFVGEPPMSFIEVGVYQNGGLPSLKILGAAEDARISLERCQDWINNNGLPDTFRVGVRATDLSVSLNHQEDQIAVEVYVVETLGHRNIVTAKLGDSLIQMVTDPELSLEVGQTVWIDLSLANSHLFADGIALTHPVRE